MISVNLSAAEPRHMKQALEAIYDATVLNPLTGPDDRRDYTFKKFMVTALRRTDGEFEFTTSAR